MSTIEHIKKVDDKIIDNSQLIWDWYDTYRQRDYAFVIYLTRAKSPLLQVWDG